MLRTLTISLTFVVVTLIGGCTPYRMDVAQGNVITQEQVDQLRPGMTRNQVRFILGTPMIADSFHTDRWDYYYSFRMGSANDPLTRHIAVIFKNGTLANIEGDVSPGKSTGSTDTAKSPNS